MTSSIRLAFWRVSVSFDNGRCLKLLVKCNRAASEYGAKPLRKAIVTGVSFLLVHRTDEGVGILHCALTVGYTLWVTVAPAVKVWPHPPVWRWAGHASQGETLTSLH